MRHGVIYKISFAENAIWLVVIVCKQSDLKTKLMCELLRNLRGISEYNTDTNDDLRYLLCVRIFFFFSLKCSQKKTKMTKIMYTKQHLMLYIVCQQGHFHKKSFNHF